MANKKRINLNHPTRFKTSWASHIHRARCAGAEGGFRPEDWLLILEYYAPDDRCLACGEETQLSVDHVIPLAKGGTNWPGNLQPLCKSCNSAKNNRAVDYRPDKGEFGQRLTERRKKDPGPWQKIAYLRPIWEKRESERGKVISYQIVAKKVGIDSNEMFRYKFGYGGLPGRKIIQAICDLFFCQPEDIVYDTVGQKCEQDDTQQLSLFDEFA